MKSYKHILFNTMNNICYMFNTKILKLILVCHTDISCKRWPLGGGGDLGCLYSLSGAPARPRRGSQHRPPRPPADLLRRPPPGPQHPPPRPPLTSSTAPSTALSTHPHGAPYHPTKRPLRGPQHPPPGVPPPPHQSPPPRLPAPTPTAPH